LKLGVFWRLLGNSAVYYPKLAKVTGGVTAAVLFCQLLQKQSELENPHDWVKITVDEIESETGLSYTEQRLARKRLMERSLLKERLVDDANILELWPDLDAFEQRLEDFSQSNCLVTSAPNQAQVKVISQSNGYSTKTTAVEVLEVLPNSAINNKNDKFFQVQRQPIAVKVTPNYQFSGPWNSQEQFEEFQRALLEHFKNKGIDNPAGLVIRIIDGITKGLVSPFWDEFIQGIPLGETQKIKRDWEIEPGTPYPAFKEERIQYYVQKGEPLETAVAKASSELRDPVVGKDLWEGFLRKCDRIADDAIRAKNLGVTTPYLPPSFTDKPQVTKESVMNKLDAIGPQFSLASSKSDDLINLSLEQQKVVDQDIDSISNAPTIASLQSAYKTPMGRNIVAKQIAEHPEWGYGIVDDEVVDLIPF